MILFSLIGIIASKGLEAIRRKCLECKPGIGQFVVIRKKSEFQSVFQPLLNQPGTARCNSQIGLKFQFGYTLNLQG